MAEIAGMTISGIRCDSPGCAAEISGKTMEWFSGRDHYEALAKSSGWSCYVGRSRRFYCATHVPRPGHKMTLLWGPQ